MITKSDVGWDLAVSDRNGQLVLAVEVKRKINASPEWATNLRRNMLAHGIFPDAPYFLLVFPDQFYLWSAPDVYHDQTQPTYQVDASPILQPYCERAGVTADQISGYSLELIVTSWLGEIISSNPFPENIHSSQQWLLESGLYNALLGGEIRFEAKRSG